MTTSTATLARMLEAKPFERLSVSPVTVRVTQGNPSDVARLLDVNTPITAAEFAEIEGRVS